jgi:hypothetical protein
MRARRVGTWVRDRGEALEAIDLEKKSRYVSYRMFAAPRKQQPFRFFMAGIARGRFEPRD